jgi:hypothetical protein
MILGVTDTGRSRLLALLEPFPDPRLVTLARPARGCLSARRMVGDEAPQIGACAGTIGRKPAAGSASILDALDKPRGGNIEVSFDRPVSNPRPALLDRAFRAIREQETTTMTDGIITESRAGSRHTP